MLGFAPLSAEPIGGLPSGAEAAVDLVGSSSVGASTGSTGAVTYTPPAAGVTNLVGSSSVGAAVGSTGAVTFTPAGEPGSPPDVVPMRRMFKVAAQNRIARF